MLEFHGIPALTANLEGPFNAELEEVRIDLENVRAVGDAAPGDARTTRDELRLEWYGASDDDGGEAANNDPVLVTFDQAPPGLYSNVYAEVVHYRLQGQVEVDSNEREFDIDDSPSSSLAIAIPLGGVDLEAGETRHVSVDVSCGAVVLGVAWDTVEEQDGDLVVDEGDADHIGGVRDAMQAAFAYSGDSGATE